MRFLAMCVKPRLPFFIRDVYYADLAVLAEPKLDSFASQVGTAYRLAIPVGTEIVDDPVLPVFQK